MEKAKANSLRQSKKSCCLDPDSLFLLLLTNVWNAKSSKEKETILFAYMGIVCPAWTGSLWSLVINKLNAEQLLHDTYTYVQPIEPHPFIRQSAEPAAVLGMGGDGWVLRINITLS